MNQIDKSKIYKCPWCDEQKKITKICYHASKKHFKSSQEVHIELFYGGIHPLCKCGCGEKRKFWNGTFSEILRGHNRFNDLAKQNAILSRRKKSEAGELTSWNVDLTAKTDPRVAASAVKIKIAMNTDETKQKIKNGLESRTQEEKDLQYKRISETKKQNYADGIYEPWNKNDNKYSNPILEETAKKISATRLVSDNTNRFTKEKVTEIILNSNTFTPVDNFLYQNKYTKFDVRCKMCNKLSQKNILMLRDTPVCFWCNPNESKGQLEVYEFVCSLIDNDKVKLSDRSVITPKELDIYVPSKKFAIEYDGLYWHSSKFISANYHNNKQQLCEKNNISCIRIFEDEWRDKKSIVESMIKHRLGLTQNKIGARKCKIKQLSIYDRKQFFNENHLDGDVSSKISWGLFYGDILVAAISLRSKLYKKSNEIIEIGRFATKKDWSISGALNKLMNNIIMYCKDNNIKHIQTFVDTRIGNGKGYSSIGFKLLSTTRERFWWTDYKKRFDRYSIRADKNNNLTQNEVAQLNGLISIYGCSNKLFQYTI